jgi:hypothetical protein
MAKVEKEKAPQVAKCVKVVEYKAKDKAGHYLEDQDTGNPVVKEFYEFAFMDDLNRTFIVYPSKYFQASEGDFFTPVIAVYAKAYNDNEGKARVKNATAINWEIYQ